jgi:hypothetical protein
MWEVVIVDQPKFTCKEAIHVCITVFLFVYLIYFLVYNIHFFIFVTIFMTGQRHKKSVSSSIELKPVWEDDDPTIDQTPRYLEV